MSDPFPPQSAAPTTPGLLERFVARLLDGLIVGIPTGLVMSIVLGIAGLGDEAISLVLVSAVVGVAQLAYFLHFESTTGQTIGKRVMSLRTVDAAGGVPSQQQALRRNVWLALSIFSGIPVLGFLTGLGSLAAVVAIAVTINSSPLGRGWHDNLAGTAVVRAS